MSSLSALYAQVPDIECKGLCHQSCGPLVLGSRERAAIRSHGVTIPDLALRCPALNRFNRCAVHPARPMLCRLYGVAEGLPCGFGCVPERVLPDVEARALLAQVDPGHTSAIPLAEPRGVV